jgi:hypothetical protein
MLLGERATAAVLKLGWSKTLAVQEMLSPSLIRKTVVMLVRSLKAEPTMIAPIALLEKCMAWLWSRSRSSYSWE